MNNFFHGVLNTGRRRYAHPALSGSLPMPWLPSVARPKAFGDGAKERRGVVLSLRRKKSKKLRKSQGQDQDEEAGDPGDQGFEDDAPQDWARGSTLETDGVNAHSRSSSISGRSRGSQLSTSALSNPWRDPTPVPGARSEGNSSNGRSPTERVLATSPDEERNVWGDEPSSEDDEDGEGPPESPVSRAGG